MKKRMNAAYRKGGWDAVGQAFGFDAEKVAKLKAHHEEMLRAQPWHDNVVWPAYEITNLGAEIRRVKARIEELSKTEDEPEREPIVGNGYRIEEDKLANRIRFYFDTRPSREVCQQMKRAGFRWSPTEGAWQRHLNAAGRYAAERMAAELFPPPNATQ
jgi:hypothetical protein